MSSFTLNLSSVGAPISPTGDGSDFTVKYSGNPVYPNTHYEAALVKLSTWYSWYNIRAIDGNNTLEYSVNSGGAWSTIIIPDGIYNITDLNSVIASALDTAGHYTLLPDGVTKLYHFEFFPNMNQGRLHIVINDTGNTQVRFTTGGLYLLLGWTATTVTVTSFAPLIANITGGITSLVVQIPGFVDGSYSNGVHNSGIIFTFTPANRPGGNLDFSPSNPIYLPVTPSALRPLRQLRVRLLDQSLQPLPGGLNGDHTVVVLHVRAVKSSDTQVFVEEPSDDTSTRMRGTGMTLPPRKRYKRLLSEVYK